MNKNKSKLIQLLEQNSRISVNSLCKELDLSRSTVYNLINTLLSDGTIKRFTIERGDTNEKDYTKFYVILRYDTSKSTEVFKAILDIPNLHTCELLFGEYDVLLTFYASDIKNIDELRLALHQIENIFDVHTFIRQRVVNTFNVDKLNKELTIGSEVSYRK